MEFSQAHMECPQHDDTAAIARINALSFTEVRNELRAAHIRNSFKGAEEHKLRQLLFLHHHGAVPAKYFCYNHASESAVREYADLLNDLSLSSLGALVPDEVWAHYNDKGWLQFELPLCEREKKMLQLVHLLQFVELGVDPGDPSTYQNADNHAGIMRCVGWLRNPALSQNNCYLSAHPLLYAQTVGIYARSLMQLNYADTVQNRRACIELLAQVYNTKLKLPSAQLNSFAHMDLQWRCLDILTPAPQIIVATSSSCQAGGEEGFAIRFANLGTPDNLRRMHEEAAQSATSHEPYDLPRRSASRYHGATDVPEFARPFFDSDHLSSGPATHAVGAVTMFSALAAHRVTEYANASQVRTSEYPLLVSPLLHGVPNQSKAEVHAAMLQGVLPSRWGHVYTGNPMRARSFADVRPIMDFMPIAMPSKLGRCLYQLAKWDKPAIAWLRAACLELQGSPGQSSALVDACLQRHAGDALAECRCLTEQIIEQCTQRLRSYARPSAALLAEWYRRQSSGDYLVGPLDADIRQTVPSAARQVLSRLGHTNDNADALELAVDTMAGSQAESGSFRDTPTSRVQQLCAHFDEVRRRLPTHSRDNDGEGTGRASRSRSNSPAQATPRDWMEGLLRAIATHQLPTIARDQAPLQLHKLPCSFVHLVVASRDTFAALGASGHADVSRAGSVLSLLFERVEANQKSRRLRIRHLDSRNTWYAFTAAGFDALADAARAVTPAAIDAELADLGRAHGRQARLVLACPHCRQMRVCIECDVAAALHSEGSAAPPGGPAASDDDDDDVSVDDACSDC